MPLYDEINQMVNNKAMDRLKETLNDQDTVTLVDLIQELPRQKQVIAFRLLNKDLAIEVFEKLELNFQEELISSFAENEVIDLMTDLAPDDRARLLDELPAKVAERVMNVLSAQEREMTAELLGYKPETAGRIMNPEYISFKKGITVREALDQIRSQGLGTETVHTLYVTDPVRKLEGVLSLRVLVMADPGEKIENIMYDQPVSVSTFTDQEDVARLLQQQDLMAVPVVDRENRLVGIVTFDDAMDVIGEETTEDIFNMAGLSRPKEIESDRSRALISGSLRDVWKIRLPYLFIALVGGLLAGGVIETFEASLEAITALAFFIPVVMDMGGNVGTQSATIFARALVLGQINVRRFMQHLFREIGIGVSMGALLGLITGVIAGIWQQFPELGLVVGLSLTLTVTVASTLGFLIPFLLYKLGLDQAAGSNPIITTLKDITGLFIYFFLVDMFLGFML